MTLKALLGAAAIAALAACGSPDARADLPESGRVVDSILPREEALRRFREGLAPVDSLAGATCSVSPAFCCAQTVPVNKSANPNPAPHRARKVITKPPRPTLMPNLYTSGYAARPVPPERHES